MYICVYMYAFNPRRSGKGVSFELKLQMALSHYMSTGTRTQVLWKSNQ